MLDVYNKVTAHGNPVGLEVDHRIVCNDIDVNGVGFDAYQDKKLIHIRSGVKIVIRQNARNHMDADQSKAPEQSEAAREFERMQSEILKETNLDQEETSK